MKKFLPILLLIGSFLISNTTIGITPPITTTIQTPVPASNACVAYDVAVTVADFTNVGAISLVLNFNPSKLVYQGVTLNGFTPQVSPGCPFPGEFRLGWYGTPFPINNGAPLFTLHFTLLPTIPGDTTNIKWSHLPGDCEYAGPNGTPVYNSSFNPLLAWTIPGPLTASSVAGPIACYGGTTMVTVSASGGTLPYSGTGTFTVSAGPYSFTVTDASGCTSITTGTITQPANIIITSIQPPIQVQGSCGAWDVPVTVEDFCNIGAISLVINFNPAKLAYQGVTVNGFTPQVQPGCPFPGQFRLGWYGAPLSLNYGATLFTLHFTLQPNIPLPAGDTTNLKWSRVTGDCEYAGPNGTPVYSGNLVDFADLTPFLTLPYSTLAADFSAGNTTPPKNTTVVFTDLTTGGPCPTNWSWNFDRPSVVYVNGTSATSQNPQVQFTEGGSYTVSLLATNTNSSSTVVKSAYIQAGIPGLWNGTTSTDWNTTKNWDNWLVPGSSTVAVIPSTAVNWPVCTNIIVGVNCNSLILDGSSMTIITGDFTINPGSSLIFTDSGSLQVGGNWTNSGSFNAGTGTIEFIGTNPSTIFNSGVFYNLEVSKTSPATLVIPPGTTITVNGDLTINQ